MKERSPSREFRKVLESLSRRHDTRRVFDAFTRFAACPLAAQTREAEYLQEVKRWNKEELVLFAEAFAALVMEMESKPFEDVIGGFYMDAAISQKGPRWNGEFHTTKHICDLMARLTISNTESFPVEGPITICEPACGAGAMILSLAEVCQPEVRRRLRVTAIDINRTACGMAFINTTLWGVPTRVIHGNSLSMDCWAAWSNIHYIMPWLSLVLRSDHHDAAFQGEPPARAEVDQIKATLAQQEFALGL